MQEYKKLVQHVLDNGTQSEERTGIGSIKLFGPQSEYNLRDGLPMVTLKKTPFRSVLSELLWFIEGSNDERRLAEILHNTRDDSKTTIWTQNANAPYWKHKSTFHGDVGSIYGVQWRSWLSNSGHNVDQLKEVIRLIKEDPNSRRIIMTAWNPGEIPNMALPPCHVFSQFFVTNDGHLDCKMYQRSADIFLGVPFNITSYALLTMMIAQVCGLKAGRLIHTLGDAHIYLNHIDQVKLMLEREPYDKPQVQINPNILDIDLFTMEDFTLLNYKHHPRISADMAV